MTLRVRPDRADPLPVGPEVPPARVSAGSELALAPASHPPQARAARRCRVLARGVAWVRETCARRAWAWHLRKGLLASRRSKRAMPIQHVTRGRTVPKIASTPTT